MSAETMSAAQLLRFSDLQFDSTVKDLSVKGLLDTISVLQKEMTKEQENFNQLSAQLATLRKNSGQYKSVSKEMTASQTRLTLLMDRSMKCFTQQNKSVADAKSSTKDSQASDSKVQQHSTKESTENAQSVKPVVKTVDKKPERQSAPNLQALKGIAPQPVVLKPVNISENTQVPAEDVKSNTFNIKPLKPVSVQLNRTSIEVKTDKSEPTIPSSFADAKSRFSSGSVPNESSNKNYTTVVKSKTFTNGTVKEQTTSTDTKGVPNRNNMQTVSVVNEINTNEVHKSNGSVLDTNKHSCADINSNDSNPVVKPKSRIITQKTDTKVNNDVGPMANQKSKFISKSTGDVFALNSNKTEQKHNTDVVKGFQSTKPKTMIVMTQDKQAIDLDSFVDRKQLMNEIKQFDKELNQVVKSDSVHEVKLHIAPKNSKANEHVDKKQENKPSILDEIKQLKKPSEIKSTKVQVPGVQKENESRIKPGAQMVQKENNESKVIVEETVRNKKLVSESRQSNTTGVGRSTNKEVSQIQMFDDILCEVDNEDDDWESESQSSEIRDIVPSVQTREATSSVTDESEDNQSDISDADEARFVTEFQFGQTEKTEPAPLQKGLAVDQHSKVQPVPTTKSNATTTITTGNGVKVTGGTAVAMETDDDDKIQARISFTNWDPSRLLADLYQVKMMPDTTEDISHQFIGMEGLMEKLPMNKKKATLLKTWKRRFFHAKDGWLHYFETGNRDRPSDSLQLMGGKVEELGPRVLGVDDGRGKYLMVRIPTDREYGQWKVALESQTADNVKATYVRPSSASIANPLKKVVIVDIGSSSIRAGILGERPTLPHIFFPSVIATNKQTGEIVIGADAYRPDIRKSSTISHPIRPTNKVDKFNIDLDVMPEIFKKVFKDLRINPKEYWIMLSTPQNLGDKMKEGLMRILMEQLGMRGACMVQQALLALYSYNSMSGIIVDLGERMEILPIYDGLLIEGGVSRQAYGGAKVHDSLYLSLLEHKYKFSTPVEKLIVRHICEQACYVAGDYKEEKAKCDVDPKSLRTRVDLDKYQLPDGSYPNVDVDISRFKSPEGFFNTDHWGMDYPNIHKLIYHGIQQSPMDARKHMYRSVYLSGGVTMLPGFAERLQLQLKKLAPPSVVVEVHASPQRYHAAYIGACSVAGMDIFSQSCVTADEWRKLGIKACRKWGTS